MKRIKKLVSLLLAMVMTLAMTMTAFASEQVPTAKGEGDFTITLTDSKAGHTYEAYQIFKGDLLETKGNDGVVTERVLSNIEWGDGITDGNALYTALESVKGFEALKDKVGDARNARAVAEILQAAENDSELARKFADTAAGYLNATNKKNSDTGTKAQDDSYTYKITELNAGYYLVQDQAGSLTGEGADAYTRYIMQVVSSVDAVVKSEIPDIDKKIVTGPNEADRAVANNAGIGEVVTYEITGNVPDRTDYETYFYVISDTLHPGLTFNNDVKVTVNGVPQTLGTDYYLYTKDSGENAPEGKTFELAFANILDTKYVTGAKIVVTYSATVNDQAVIGGTGNDNTVYLNYSNNPNTSNNGTAKPGVPDSNVPTGKSPDHVTLTYVAQIDLLKQRPAGNGETDNQPLPGAEFTLTGKSYQTVLEGGTYYVEAANGEYWLLKDGTYTKDDPATEGMDQTKYVSTTVKYNEETADSTTVVETPVKMVITSDTDGKVLFKGLGAGVYEIEETVVPAGYNKADIVKVELVFTPPTTVTKGETKGTWSVGNQTTAKVDADGKSTDEKVATISVETSGSYDMAILNQSGSTLPSTGGIGTTIFYVVGAVLVIGAGILLVTKKRMSAR